MGRVFSSIFWALAHPCPLRDPSDWHGGKIEPAASYSDGLRNAFKLPQVIEDVYVGSWYGLEGVRRWSYPASGYSLNREYAAIGGLEGLRALCRSCPACTTPEPAGCVGQLMGEEPDDFEELVDSLGLRAELRRYFPVTTPLWYGLWINTVIPAEAISLLHALLGALETKNQRRAEGYAAILQGLEIAERTGMALHVQRTPGGALGGPGAHCRRCTAFQALGEAITCTVCGHTGSTKPSKWRFPGHKHYRRDDLFQQLGETRFAEITRQQLRAQDAPEAELDALVTEILDRERTRPVWGPAQKAEWKRAEESAKALQKRQDRYKRLVLYKGIPHKRNHFRAPEFRLLLERCVALGIQVTSLSHDAEEFAKCRIAYRGEDPLEMLDKWQAEGLNEWFTASYEIPEVLLSRAD